MGNYWTAGPTVTGMDGMYGFIFYAMNVAAGTQTIDIKSTSCGNQGTIYNSEVVAEFYNVATSSAGDGSNSHAATAATSITCGSITPSQDGDLFFQAAFRTDSNTPVGATSFAKGLPQSNITWQLLTTDLLDGLASQYGVQDAHTSVTPTFTMAGPADYMCLAQAFKAASAGTAPAAGIRVV